MADNSDVDYRCKKHRRLVCHDDTCSSYETNHKDAQISPEELSGNDIPSLNEDTPDDNVWRTYTQQTESSNTPETRTLTLFTFKEEGVTKQDIPFRGGKPVSSLLDGLQFSPPLSPSAIRHKYLVESSITRTSPIQFRTPPNQTGSRPDDFTTLTTKPKLSYRSEHRSSVASEQYESVLTEIHQRCKTNDVITRDLEEKLESKNQQLSQNCVLLEECQENITRLQRQLDEARNEKSELKSKVREHEKEWRAFQKAKYELEEAMHDVTTELRKAEETITQRDAKIDSLVKQFSDMTSKYEEVEKRHSEVLAEKKSSSEVVQQQKGIIMNAEDRIQKLEGELLNKEKTLLKLKNEVDVLQAQIEREEKRRKQVEKENHMVTLQGQTLMEHQCALQSRHAEELKELKDKIKQLENQLEECENVIKTQANKMDEHERNSRDSILQLTGERNELTDKLATERQNYVLQSQKDQQVITKLNEELKETKETETKLQHTIETLEAQHKNSEQKYEDSKQHLVEQNKKLNIEIQHLKDQLQREKTEWQKAFNDLNTKEKRLSQLHASELHLMRQNAEKESIDFKCRIEELEEKLDERDAALTTLKDTILELTEGERHSEAAYIELLADFETNKDESQKMIEEKNEVIKQLNESIANMENESQNSMKKEIDVNDLNKKLLQHEEERSKLESLCEKQEHEIKTLRKSLEEQQKISGQVVSMRALLSKKESSKAILVAEHQRLEREYSIALSHKASEVASLEHELRTLQAENTTLKNRQQSDIDRVVSNQGNRSIPHDNDDSYMVSNSMTTANFPTKAASKQGECESINEKLLIAKRHSSNQILATENVKLKSELKKAETWWQRDINELQRRFTAQQSVISHMERKMTNLEIENVQLKRNSQDTFTDQAGAIGGNTVGSKLSGYANLLEHYKRELSIKDNKIHNLEASLLTAKGDTAAAVDLIESVSERERVVKQGLEAKLSQNEIDVIKLKDSLSEVEAALDKQDSKATQNLLRKSSNQLEVLVENLKHSNQTTSSALELSAEKQASLLKLHQRFSQTLAQIHKDAIKASEQQKQQFEELRNYFEAQVTRLEQSLQDMLKEKGEEIAKLTCENTQLLASNTALTATNRELESKAESTLHELDMLRHAKQSLEHRAKAAEDAVSKLEIKVGELTTKLNVTDTNMMVELERRASLAKSDYDMKMNKLVTAHQKEVKETLNKLKHAEDENTRLHSEINRLQQRVSEGSQELETEVRELHGKLQKVQMEKTDLQDKFKEGIQSLRQDNEMILKERNQNIHRLSCELTELEAKNDALKQELQSNKEITGTLRKQMSVLKEENLSSSENFKAEISRYESKLKEMNEKLTLDNRQIAKALEDLTKAEIENIRLKNYMKKEYEELKDNEAKLQTTIASLKHELEKRGQQYKQAVTDVRKLKSTLKSSEREYKLVEDKIQQLKAELAHAESVTNMYKTELEAVHKKSEARIYRVERAHSQRLFSLDSYKRPTRQGVCEQESMESLGGKIAELTNELTAKSRQLETTERQLMEQKSKNDSLNETIRLITRQRDELLMTVESMTKEVESLQSRMKSVTKDKETVNMTYYDTLDKLEKLSKELNEAQRENNSLQKKLSDTQILMDKAKSEDRTETLKQRVEELNRKLSRTKETNCEIEKKMVELTAKCNSEKSVLQNQLEDAFTANQSLEKYIRGLQKSYSQMFDDADDGFSPQPRRSSGCFRDAFDM